MGIIVLIWDFLMHKMQYIQDITIIIRSVIIAILFLSCDSELEIETSSNNELLASKTSLEANNNSTIPEQYYIEILSKFDPMLICDNVSIEFTSSQSFVGTKDCSKDSSPSCVEDGQTDCIVSNDFKSAKTDDIASKILIGNSIAGISGTYSPDFPSQNNVRSNETVNGLPGTLSTCNGDGEENCVTSALFKAAQMANASSGNIKSGVTIAGVSGTYGGGVLSDCSSDGELGCKTVASFRAVDMSNVTAGNVKSGITIAGVSGDYPSATYPLTGASATADLTSSGFNTSLASASSFEYWTSEGSRQIGAGDADLA